MGLQRASSGDTTVEADLHNELGRLQEDPLATVVQLFRINEMNTIEE